jgi:hypothetical protein
LGDAGQGCGHAEGQPQFGRTAYQMHEAVTKDGAEREGWIDEAPRD